MKEKSERGYLVPTHHPFYASFILFTFCAHPRGKKTKQNKRLPTREMALNWKASFSQWIGPNPIGDCFLGVALSASFEWDIFLS
jgi:hypothetical protein